MTLSGRARNRIVDVIVRAERRVTGEDVRNIERFVATGGLADIRARLVAALGGEPREAYYKLTLVKNCGKLTAHEICKALDLLYPVEPGHKCVCRTCGRGM